MIAQWIHCATCLRLPQNLRGTIAKIFCCDIPQKGKGIPIASASGKEERIATALSVGRRAEQIRNSSLGIAAAGEQMKNYYWGYTVANSGAPTRFITRDHGLKNGEKS